MTKARILKLKQAIKAARQRAKITMDRVNKLEKETIRLKNSKKGKAFRVECCFIINKIKKHKARIERSVNTIAKKASNSILSLFVLEDIREELGDSINKAESYINRVRQHFKKLKGGIKNV